MYYDEVIIEGELFYKTHPSGGWVRATNAQCTARIEKLEAEVAHMVHTLAEIQLAMEKYKE